MDVSYAAIYLSWTLHRGILWYYYYLFFRSFTFLDKREPPKQEIWTYNVVISFIHVRRMFSVFEITFCVCVLFLVLLVLCVKVKVKLHHVFEKRINFHRSSLSFHGTHVFLLRNEYFSVFVVRVYISATCIGFYGICSGSYFRFCFSFYLFLVPYYESFCVFSFTRFLYVIVIIINIISLVVEEKLEQQDTTAKAGKNNVI